MRVTPLSTTKGRHDSARLRSSIDMKQRTIIDLFGLEQIKKKTTLKEDIIYDLKLHATLLLPQCCVAVCAVGIVCVGHLVPEENQRQFYFATFPCAYYEK